MEYKFYKSTTLKSIALNDDTNIIFDIAKPNNRSINALITFQYY